MDLLLNWKSFECFVLLNSKYSFPCKNWDIVWHIHVARGKSLEKITRTPLNKRHKEKQKSQRKKSKVRRKRSKSLMHLFSNDLPFDLLLISFGWCSLNVKWCFVFKNKACIIISISITFKLYWRWRCFSVMRWWPVVLKAPFWDP